MKKLSNKYKKVLLYRSRRASRKRRLPQIHVSQSVSLIRVDPFRVSVWDGEEPYIAECRTSPLPIPEKLCLYDNPNETLIFLKRLYNSVKSTGPRKNKKSTWIHYPRRGLPRIRSYYDFSAIGHLSTAVALIMTSYYDRAKRLLGGVPPAVNLDEWSDDAFKVLYEIGFFELIGHVHGNHPALRYHDIDGGRYRLMQIISGQNGNELENVAVGISGLMEFLNRPADEETSADLALEINTAVGEAMINVARHAYSEEFKRKHRFDSIGSWWVTARADRGSNTLTIVIYDHGATIPGTLPYRAWYDELLMEIKTTLGLEHLPRAQLDHEFIAYSMKPGKTQTKEPGRGQGLPQMQELIDFCGSGCLRIYSRAGAYCYELGAGVSKLKLDLPIRGTLVEWELQLPTGS